MTKYIAVAVALLAACVTEPDAPETAVDQPSVAWFEPSTPEEQATLREGAAAQRFEAMNPGAWELDFDPVLETPRVVRGSGEAIDDPVGFAIQHADLFGATELVVDGELRSGEVTQIVLAQRHHGVPVLGAHLGLSIAHGRLVLVQGATYRIGELDVTPRIDAEAAIVAAEAALDSAIDATPRLAILPERSVGSVSYRLVWEVTTPDGVLAHIDADTGALVDALDDHRHDYAGSVTSRVDERTIGSPIVTVPNAYNTVEVSGLGSMDTDASGGFSFASSLSGTRIITSTLRGPHVQVTNLAAGSAAFSGTIENNQPASVVWNSSVATFEERDAFRAVNVTNRFVATVFPSVPWIESVAVPVKVNFNQNCNSFWDGSSIYTNREGGGCNNAGRIFDVVAHEWAHGLDENLPGGAQDAALGELIGDLVVFTQTDDPIVGPGFFQDGRPVRDMNEPELACYDSHVTEIHAAGQILGEILWDIHEDLEQAGVTGEALKRRMLLPIGSAQTRSQWYSALLVADDDDGSLANGTPNECLIYRQFEAHSCLGTAFPGMPASPPARCGPPAPMPAATTTTLTSSANPSAVGQPVTFTADVSSTTAPAGWVNLSVDGWVVQYATVSALDATTSRATFAFPTMAEGSHAVVATFVPSSLHRTSSASLGQTVSCAIEGAVASPDVITGGMNSFASVQVGIVSACDAARYCSITDVSMNEADRRPLGDWAVTSALGVSLRTERWSFGTGRIYDIEVTCSDGTAAPSTHHAYVSVPR